MAVDTTNAFNFNRYAYANNSPYKFTDPDGRVIDTIFDAGDVLYNAGQIFGGVAAYAVGAATGDQSLMNVAAQGVADRRADMAIAGAALIVPGVNSAALKAGGAAADVARVANRGCSFDANTYVLTENGLRRIADIKSGDRVLARDEETGDNAYQRVLASFNEWHERTLTVAISTGDDSESIVTTDEHPFFVIDRGFVPAAQLHIGDVVSLADQGHAEVTLLRRNDTPQTAYNLTVEDDHTYFVGENGVWVHNACVPKNLSPPGAGRQGAFNEAKRQSGIPTSQQPSNVTANKDRRGNVQPGRTYEFEVPSPGGGTKTVTIRDDAGGHDFGAGNPQNRGQHFNDEAGGHYDY
jgi:hypothetical protein